LERGPLAGGLFVFPLYHASQMFDHFVIVGAICAGIAVAVWGLFQLGAFIGVQWYVSAVAILLIGKFIMDGA
jgi:hypothetical protein